MKTFFQIHAEVNLKLDYFLCEVNCSDKSKKLFALNIEILVLKRKFEFSWKKKKTICFLHKKTHLVLTMPTLLLAEGEGMSPPRVII